MLLLIILLVTIGILIQQPKIQTWVSNTILNRIESQTGTKASLDHVNIKFPKKILLDGFYLEDLEGDTLLYAGQLMVDINFFHPFKRRLDVGAIQLDNARIFMRKPGEDAPYNFESQIAFDLHRKNAICQIKLIEYVDRLLDREHQKSRGPRWSK